MGYGDELMVTGELRRLQRKDRRKVRLYYGKGLKTDVFNNNPRVAGPKDTDFQMYEPRVNGMRPYCRAKSETRWIWQEYAPLPGELYFDRYEIAFADTLFPRTPASSSEVRFDVVLEPHLKHRASPNKDWGWERWQTLAQLIGAAGLRPIQLGPPGTKLLNGARLVQTSGFRLACAALTRARAAVVHEGGLHHAAAALGVPAVVIFGGFISPAQTGYRSAGKEGGDGADLLAWRSRHINLFTGGEPCGWRIACKHCAQAMAAISPEEVFASLMRLLAA